MTKKKNKTTELEQQNGELLLDLQRTRADFENFRKTVEEDRIRTKASAERALAFNLLGVIDDIDRATTHLPKDLKNNAWAQGVLALNKKMAADLKKVGLERIQVSPGDQFNPELHEAVLVDEDSTGEQEVVAEIMRTGYLFRDEVLRPTSVKVKRQ